MGREGYRWASRQIGGSQGKGWASESFVRVRMRVRVDYNLGYQSVEVCIIFLC